MHIVVGLKHAVFQEGQQVHRRQITGGVVQEHIFRTGVRAADRAIFRAGVPGVDGVVILNARIGAGPGRVTDLFPQLAGLYRLGNFAVGAPDQFPRGVVFDCLQIGVGNANRVVGILP